METFDVDIAWISLLDRANDIWSVETRDKRFYQESCNLRGLQHTDGYIALIEIHSNQLARVLDTEMLQLPQDVVRTHFAWRQPDQLDAQGALWYYAETIENTVLKEFITNILSDAKIMHPFYIARASQDYHHNEKGGLFKHSVQVALTAIHLACNHELEEDEVECAFVCGLLHDIGKIMMFYNTDKNQQKGVNGQHEAFSFMVLAEHLERLKAQDKTLFEAVSATLSANVNGKKHCEYVIETIVRAADLVSAEAYQSRAAFKGKPASLLRASFHSGKHYKRLKQM
ncbi:HD domain-containing protein [Thiopseudomonas alkaliphila]|uniref:HD domain-containing protein n=1 Tax=Thiopseudomonas alkaliphila TaxID=1697053 RepID=A0AAW7DTP6_9GAMM|nr:HD domain-containing protein [Thiopseudomonas alkaliphila]MDM1697224.1 HD domain-containing protein [Thiopseudomonas alkaliphila]